jgi:hypothetical protein
MKTNSLLEFFKKIYKFLKKKLFKIELEINDIIS